VAARRVLVVDDDGDLREIARLSLEIAGGFEVATAADGEEAVRLAQDLSPHVIVMDVRMPGVDGIETFRRLRADERTRGVPVVFLTGSGQLSEERARLTGLGAAAVAEKPFVPAELVRVIEHVTAPGAAAPGDPGR
jgi:CheY-like chemotaxis protein